MVKKGKKKEDTRARNPSYLSPWREQRYSTCCIENSINQTERNRFSVEFNAAPKVFHQRGICKALGFLELDNDGAIVGKSKYISSVLRNFEAVAFSYQKTVTVDPPKPMGRGVV